MSLLYGIIPFFDFSNSSYRKENIRRFISNYKNKNNLKLIIAEAVLEESDGLEDYSNDIFLHLKFKVKQKLWYKENLINIAINHLPKDWEYICWIDSDIDFFNKDWVDDSIRYLQSFDFIQLFDTAIVLDRKGQIITEKVNPIIYKSWLNFSKNFKKNIIGPNKFEIHNFIKDNIDNNPYLKPHTGFGWGTNKNFFSKIKKIWDQNIIGGGDNVIAKCVTQNIEEYPFQEFYSKVYESDLMNYYNQFKNCSHKVIAGSIVHYWHGKYVSRQYVDRHEILKFNNFSAKDLNQDSNGIFYIKDKYDLIEGLENYFNSRELIE